MSDSELIWKFLFTIIGAEVINLTISLNFRIHYLMLIIKLITQLHAWFDHSYYLDISHRLNNYFIHHP